MTLNNVKNFYKTYLKPDGLMEWLILSLMLLVVAGAILLGVTAYLKS